MLHVLVLPTHAIPFPQSRFDVEANVFFLVAFNFPPAFTISFSSFLQVGQNLKQVF